MKKSLLLLLIMTLVHWTAFSVTDTSRVCISKEVARLIAIDLLDGDKCKDILLVTDDNLFKCEQQIGIKDGIIAKKDSIIYANDTVNASHVAMYATLQSDYVLLQKKYKKQKRRGIFKTVGNVIIIAALATFVIVK